MNKLRVIFIHGIAPTVISWDFSERLWRLVVSKLIQYNVVPQGASADEIAETITFERVNYSKIGDDAENRLLQAYEQDAEKLYRLSNRLNRMAGLDKIRRLIITSVSDVMVYKSEYWSGEIQQMVVDKIEPYLAGGDSVSIIAHSLGSVIAFDTLRENVEHNPKWKECNFRPSNLFTMGSPIALFTLDLEHGPDIHGRDPETPFVPLANEEGVWYNFLDAQDLIAYPLEVLFSGKFKVEDIVVQTGTNPRKAHDGYWDSIEVADFIAGRLKLDFQRINAAPADASQTQTTSGGVEATDGMEPPDRGEAPDGVEAPDEIAVVTNLFGLNE
jgi:hypothetical protein